jgi:major membrane immunogen (membrane-anchored lipoprotein)
MRSFKIGSSYFMLAGLLILGACSQGEKAADKIEPTPSKIETTASPTPSQTAASAKHGESHPGGTTIETNGIHLELVPEKSADKTHLDLYVQKGDNHEPIPTAKVVAQVQNPDGKQQSLEMKYAAEDKHYTAIVPGKIAGQYQVKITADISGKKVDGRFTFDR